MTRHIIIYIQEYKNIYCFKKLNCTLDTSHLSLLNEEKEKLHMNHPLKIIKETYMKSMIYKMTQMIWYG